MIIHEIVKNRVCIRPSESCIEIHKHEFGYVPYVIPYIIDNNGTKFPIPYFTAWIGESYQEFHIIVDEISVWLHYTDTANLFDYLLEIEFIIFKDGNMIEPE
jgi:hypothetical protein